MWFVLYFVSCRVCASDVCGMMCVCVMGGRQSALLTHHLIVLESCFAGDFTGLALSHTLINPFI